MAKASVCMRSVLLHQSTASTYFSLQKTGPPVQQPRLHTLAHALSVDGRRSGAESLAQRLPDPDRGFESSASHLSSLGSGRQSCRLSSRMSFPAGRRARRDYLDGKHRRNDPPAELSLSLPIKRTTLITSSADSSTDTTGWPIPGSPAPGDGWPKVPPKTKPMLYHEDLTPAAEGDVAYKAMMAFKKGLEKKDWKDYLGMMTDDVELWVPVGDFVGQAHKGKESMTKFFHLADSTFSTLKMNIINRSYSTSLMKTATNPSTPRKSSRSGPTTDGDGVGDSVSLGDDKSTGKVTGTAMFEITTDGKFVKENKVYGNRIVVVVEVQGHQIKAHREYFGLR